MRLHEHPDFDQAILRAADHFRTRGLRAAFIEKDYYVTEALRVIANVAGDKVIFRAAPACPRGGALSIGFRKTLTCSSTRLPFSLRSVHTGSIAS